MQAIGSPVVSTGQDLGFTNATNLKDGNFQICLLAGAGSSLNMNGTSSSVFYTNNYNITSSYYFLNTPIDWNSHCPQRKRKTCMSLLHSIWKQNLQRGIDNDFKQPGIGLHFGKRMCGNNNREPKSIRIHNAILFLSSSTIKSLKT